MHLHEEAREAGWTDEQLLEAIAFVALETFTALINVAGDVPVDGSGEQATAHGGLTGRAGARPVTGAARHRPPRRRRLLPALPRGGRADRPALERGDHGGAHLLAGSRCGSRRSRAAVPQLSDRLLSERVKELEERGLVVRHVDPGRRCGSRTPPSEMGRDLAPALEQVALWARRWLTAQKTH